MQQLFFKPIVGGGSFTAAASALIVKFAPLPILLLTSGILAARSIFGLYKLQPTEEKRQIADDLLILSHPKWYENSQEIVTNAAG